MKSLFRLVIVLLILLASASSFFLPTGKSLAISNPSSISVESVRAFVGVVNSGDMLFLVEYKVMYSPLPSEPASDTFLIGVWDTSGSKGPDRGLNYYLHNINSIYLTSSEVTSFGYSKGDPLSIRVMGNPSFFSTLTEGVNVATVTLSPSHWVKGSTVSQTRSYLKEWCVSLAESLEASWGVPLLTSAGLLNATGKNYFIKAIPNLQSICPELFSVSSTYPTYEPGTHSKEFEESLAGNVGTKLGGHLETLGEFLTGHSGMGGLVGGLGLAVLYFILAGSIALGTGSIPMAIIVSIPFLIAGAVVGLLPLSILFVGTFLVLLAFGVTFILGRL